MGRLPRMLPPVALVAVAVAGLLLPGWYGALLLLAVAAFLGWLVFLSWPAITGRQRAPRLVTIVLVLVVAVLHGVTG